MNVPHKIVGNAVQERRNPTEQPIVSLEYPTVLACDALDGKDTDIYTMAAEPLPDCDGYYAAFPTLYRHAPSIKEGGEYDNNGDIETYFAGSTDGISWHRYDRTPFIKNNILEDYPTHMTFAGTGIIHENKKFVKYAALLRTRHGENDKRDKCPDGCIVRLENREYGYVEVVFEECGCFQTKPWQCGGETITVNADIGDGRFIKASLMYADGTAIPGFTADDCEPIGSGTSEAIRWMGGSLARFIGIPLKLGIIGAHCRIWGFEFV